MRRYLVMLVSVSIILSSLFLVGSPAHAQSHIPLGCSNNCSGVGYISWSLVNDGCQGEFTMTNYTGSDSWQRDVLCFDSTNGNEERGGVIWGYGTFCGNGLYLFWDDVRPSPNHYRAFHCMPLGAWNTGDVISYTVIEHCSTCTQYDVSIGDISPGGTIMCSYGNPCHSNNQQVQYLTRVHIEEFIFNYVNGTDSLDTSTWHPIFYALCSATPCQGFFQLSSSGSTISGPNPPWIGWINSLSAYSCSKFGSTNPC